MVKWDPEEEQIGERFDEREEGEHDPVRQPQIVVLFSSCLEGFEGAVNGVCKSNQVAKRASAETKKNDGSEHQKNPKNQIHASDTKFFGEVFDGIVTYKGSIELIK